MLQRFEFVKVCMGRQRLCWKSQLFLYFVNNIYLPCCRVVITSTYPVAVLYSLFTYNSVCQLRRPMIAAAIGALSMLMSEPTVKMICK